MLSMYMGKWYVAKLIWNVKKIVAYNLMYQIHYDKNYISIEQHA